MSAPILVASCDDGRYVLDTDVSDTTLGAVLQHEEGDKLHVIAYASRTPSNAEALHCITRQELLGVVFGLKKYRQHLLGRSIIVRTDHAALVYLIKMLEPIGQQDRWLDLLGEYDITIHHRPGQVHGNSDALSRRPCERGMETETGTPTRAAEPVSSVALPVVSSTALPKPLRFLPLHSLADKSSDLSSNKSTPGGRAKTCLALARCAYFPGWHSFTGMLV